MPRRTLVRALAWAPYALISAVHVTALGTQSTLAAPTKMALMPLLAIPVLVEARRIRPRVVLTLLLAALLLSWLGDEAGVFFATMPELPLMLLFFGLAHLAYIALFARHLRIRRLPWWTLVYGAWWVAMLAALGPHVGPLIIGVAGYGIVLAGTAAMAARCGPTITTGGALFLLSDSILAFRLFLPDTMPDWTSPAVMLAYAIGQGLLIAGSLAATRKQEI